MASERLDMQHITRELETLEGWSIDDGKLYREYCFENFAQTRAFIERLCDAADELNHHPEVWFTYAKAIVQIITHDAGGLTEKDFALARTI
jgi:4a-hydroxytetrahydrobiopterin dehydratase